MRNYQYAWYLDNRFYITKNFVDEFIGVVSKIKKSGKEVDGSAIKSFFPLDGNASSRITFARNVGIIGPNGQLSDSALLYRLGLFDYSEFVLEIIAKRNTTRDEAINLKPVVLLSIVFSKMAKLNIDESERFITCAECYEYLSPLESYDELTDNLVTRLVGERIYDVDSTVPKTRVKIESGAVYLSSLFNCLNDTPIFQFGEKKSILRYIPKHINFINYIAENGKGMSAAPIIGGSPRQNADFYNYLCDIRKGLFEIFPKVEVYKATPTALIKTLYNHCFGISEAPKNSLKEYVSDIPFGCFAPFITLDRLVAAYFYLHNERLGELMFDYISQVIDKEKAMEGDMIRVPFSDTNHTVFENGEGANSKGDEFYEILEHNVMGLHITNLNDALNPTNPHICIGWGILGDLSHIASKEELGVLYDEKYPEKTTRGRGQDVSQIWSFLDKLKVGDYVVFGDGKSAHIGQITSEYYFTQETPNQDADYAHNKNVKWLKDVAYQDLPHDLHKAFYATRSIFSLNEYKSVIFDILHNRVVELDEQENSKEKYVLIDRAPRANKTHPLNSILYGAPGTGKTYSTAEYALAIIEDREIDTAQKSAEERAALMSRYKELIKTGQIVFTTFHQSYGYEEFIQGLRPDTSSEKMEFKTIDGVFKRIADKAMMDETNDYVIIIDEINRANISKVFGELITLIEDDKRWGEVNAISVTLPSGESFAVPNNLYIIGTMNSADKSISLIDAALRRRFQFIEITPDYSTVADTTLKTVLERLNKGLVEALDSTDLLIGHAYFIGKTKDDLCEIMNNAIIPLLYEYFYDNAKKVKEQIKKAVEGYDFDIADNTVGRMKLVKKG